VWAIVIRGLKPTTIIASLREAEAASQSDDAKLTVSGTVSLRETASLRLAATRLMARGNMAQTIARSRSGRGIKSAQRMAARPSAVSSRCVT
jgi:hypothetical protein